jgi:hypothetical protein
MPVCHDCQKPILPNETAYTGPEGFFHSDCGDPFGIKARDAEIARLQLSCAALKEECRGRADREDRLRAAAQAVVHEYLSPLGSRFRAAIYQLKAAITEQNEPY